MKRKLLAMMITYATSAGAIWGIVEAYTYFEGEQLKLWLGGYWPWLFLGVPALVAFVVGLRTDKHVREENIPASAHPIEQAQYNRATMLQLVRNTWIVGVLEQSLHGAALLELGKNYDPQAVERPWDIELHMPTQARCPVPHGTPILDLFDKSTGALLILGEPGSGKTTTLLELARALIDRAEHDEACHIPVVLNLSSWAVKQPPLEEWLLDELRAKYYTPKKVAQTWIQEDALLLLLDGLDEVKAEARDKCLTAINTFRQEHLVPLAVCSRTVDYEALTAKLHLQAAIILRPLTPAQIDTYLAGAGAELHAVRATLQHDPILQEMAQSPLFLSIMTLAYRGKAIADLQTLATPEARRQHLFDTYVARMFQRRIKDIPYTPEQTRHWLIWLAKQMTTRNQTVFLIENLQPDWLPLRAQHLVRGLVTLIVSLMVGLFLIQFTSSVYMLTSVLSVGLSEWINSLMPPETSRWSWRRAAIGFGIGLIGGLVSGLVYRLVYGLVYELVYGLVYGLIIGAVVGLFEGVIGGIHFVICIETLKWSWRNAAMGLGVGLIFGLIFGLGAGLFVWFDTRLDAMMDAGWLPILLGLLSFGLVFGSVGGLVGGFRGADMQCKTRPNEGIRQSIKNAVVVGLGGGLVFGLGVGLDGGLVVGLSVGLVFGLIQGGKAAILHYTLRAILARTDRAPWDYARFLDACTDRILLRKVGGGYIFVHRLLQEYFALQGQNANTRELVLQEPNPSASLSPKKEALVSVTPLRIVFALLITYLVCISGTVAWILADRSAWVYIYLRVGNYEKAIELDPDNSDIYSTRAWDLYCKQENYQSALADYRKAAELSEENEGYWNALCWDGSLSGYATEVIDACEQAVTLAPNNGGIIDSRGLARALTGDYAGAIEDFQFYIKWAEDTPRSFQSDEDIALRKAWIAALEAGQNPFDDTTLQAMREQACP